MADENLIRKARLAAGLTQRELGGLLGVDGFTVSRWERGTSTPRKNLRPKIEEVTGVKIGVEMTQTEPAQ